MIVSASALVRNCGYARKLDRERPKSANAQVACDRGTVFHRAVEGWLLTGELPVVADLEIQGWLDLLASQWEPPVNAETEIAWGLSPAGGYVVVAEPAPHVYEGVGGAALLTAGRADLAFERRGVLVVVDWKSGKWPTTPAVDNLQVNAAGIALAGRTGATSYQPGIYYARDGFFDLADEVPLGSPAHERIFAEVRTAALLDETPRPGSHCTACWSKRACAHAAA